MPGIGSSYRVQLITVVCTLTPTLVVIAAFVAPTPTPAAASAPGPVDKLTGASSSAFSCPAVAVTGAAGGAVLGQQGVDRAAPT